MSSEVAKDMHKLFEDIKLSIKKFPQLQKVLDEITAKIDLKNCSDSCFASLIEILSKHEVSSTSGKSSLTFNEMKGISDEQLQDVVTELEDQSKGEEYQSALRELKRRAKEIQSINNNFNTKRRLTEENSLSSQERREKRLLNRNAAKDFLSVIEEKSKHFLYSGKHEYSIVFNNIIKNETGKHVSYMHPDGHFNLDLSNPKKHKIWIFSSLVNHLLGKNKEFSDLVQENIRYQFFLLNIFMSPTKGHSNLLVFDYKNKKIFIFDPLGPNATEGLYHTAYQTVKNYVTCDHIKNMHREYGLPEEFTVHFPRSYQTEIGPQESSKASITQMEDRKIFHINGKEVRETDGYCLAWCLLYAYISQMTSNFEDVDDVITKYSPIQLVNQIRGFSHWLVEHARTTTLEDTKSGQSGKVNIFYADFA